MKPLDPIAHHNPSPYFSHTSTFCLPKCLSPYLLPWESLCYMLHAVCPISLPTFAYVHGCLLVWLHIFHVLPQIFMLMILLITDLHVQCLHKYSDDFKFLLQMNCCIFLLYSFCIWNLYDCHFIFGLDG